MFPQPGNRQADNVRWPTEGLEAYIYVGARLWELLGLGKQPPWTTDDEKADPRVRELKDILRIYQMVHEYNQTLPEAEQSKTGFSHQLYFDLHFTINGVLGLLSDLSRRFGRGEFSILMRKLVQDPLENIFGALRQSLGGGRDVSCKDAAHGLPRLQKKLHNKALRLSKANAKKRNSGDVASEDLREVTDSDWQRGHQIFLPADAEAIHAAALARARACKPRASDGHPIVWQHLRDAHEEDLLRGLKLMPWLKPEHINRTNFSAMKVGHAIAVLRFDLGNELRLRRHGGWQ